MIVTGAISCGAGGEGAPTQEIARMCVPPEISLQRARPHTGWPRPAAELHALAAAGPTPSAGALHLEDALGWGSAGWERDSPLTCRSLQFWVV